MDVASLILSVIALSISVFCLVWMLAKHFSTHQVQLVPADSFVTGQPPKLMGEDYEEFGDIPPLPLSEDERKEAKKKGFL